MDREHQEVKVKRTQKDYSLSFKLQVVDEIEKGLITYTQSQRKYGIQGKSTVLKWLRKHGQLNWNKGMYVNKQRTPYSEIQELKARIKQLEKEKIVLNTAIDVADEMYNTNIRKKFLALSLERLNRQSEE
jgi:transposase-like protein